MSKAAGRRSGKTKLAMKHVFRGFLEMSNMTEEEKESLIAEYKTLFEDDDEEEA